MGCLRWIVNSILGMFILLFLFTYRTGVYGLHDTPDWIDGNYVVEIEKVVDAPVDKVFWHGSDELKVVVEGYEEPILIKQSAVPAPNRMTRIALGLTDVVRTGLYTAITAWVLMLGSKLVFGILRWIL